ncbi:MAG: hypothetical protein DRI79_01170 [Chloroflexi bacterium]|nr:MAG: hypothetical protein DRI79_01170 [Chloroflexota bacterium]HEY66827.1 hypothetical protein [Thermoflexia bacterium]
MSQRPTGEEREVRFLSGATIDGAPIAYIVVLAAVVAALSFIPFSAILALGGSFPMSQGVYPLVGWILGPIAGAIASGIGRLIGVFLAPHTAGPVPAASVWGAVIAGFAAGSMTLREKRRRWWIPLSVLFIIEFLLFIGRAIFLNGVGVAVALLNSFVDWSGIVLYVLPTRTLFARWINSKNIGLIAAGLFLGTWMIAGISHLSVTVILYFMFNWPEEVWITLIPVIPMEHLFRCLTGAVIGSGVIAGLRAIGLVKPTEAIY